MFRLGQTRDSYNTRTQNMRPAKVPLRDALPLRDAREPLRDSRAFDPQGMKNSFLYPFKLYSHTLPLCIIKYGGQVLSQSVHTISPTPGKANAS